MKKAFRLACFSLLLAGCSPTSPDSSPGDELRLNRARWEGSRPATYEFVLQRVCECVPPLSTPLRITVHERQIQSVVNAQTEEALSADSDLAESIEDLFTLLEQALENGAHRVEAEYDPAFGYPTSIYIDHEEPMVDEETVFRVQGLRTVH